MFSFRFLFFILFSLRIYYFVVLCFWGLRPKSILAQSRPINCCSEEPCTAHLVGHECDPNFGAQTAYPGPAQQQQTQVQAPWPSPSHSRPPACPDCWSASRMNSFQTPAATPDWPYVHGPCSACTGTREFTALQLPSRFCHAPATSSSPYRPPTRRHLCAKLPSRVLHPRNPHPRH